MDNDNKILDKFIMQSMSASHVPTYGLYGETDDADAPDPTHVETLKSRSQKNRWRIRPHRHPRLQQLMILTEGGGQMVIEGRREAIVAPALISVPAGVTHSFLWSPDSDGYVLMAADDLIRSTPGASALLGRPFQSGGDIGDDLPSHFRALMHLPADPRVRMMTARGYAGLILAAFIDAQAKGGQARLQHSASADLVRRYRDLAERDFTRHRPVPDYCSELGVSPARLARACRDVADASPLEILHARLLLEARRLLAYSSLSVAGVGEELGFLDPAYFSRFFTARMNMAPARWRRCTANEGEAVAPPGGSRPARAAP